MKNRIKISSSANWNLKKKEIPVLILFPLCLFLFLSRTPSLSLTQSLSARRLTQCSRCYPLCSILGTYVLLHWQMLIQLSPLTCSCWREVSAFVPHVWKWNASQHFVYLVVIAFPFVSPLWSSVLAKDQTVFLFGEPLSLLKYNHGEERLFLYTHFPTTVVSVFSLSLSPSLCNRSMCSCDLWP